MKKILFVGSEALPFAASGGLGDVMGSLPKVIAEAGNDVRVVLPLYSSISEKYLAQFDFLCSIDVCLSWRKQYCGIFRYVSDGVTYYFIDNEYYFKRGMLYGEYDDGERFAFFSKAVLDILPTVGFFPDIMHCNDWQTALCTVYLKKHYSAFDGYSGIRTVFTIHNIQYQGEYGMECLSDLFGLGESDRETVEYNGNINLLKAAVVCADAVNTVSPTYAKEILSPQYSHGLHYVLEQHKGKLCGILNGIDLDYYNPQKDAVLAKQYTWRSADRKKINKRALQSSLSLPESDAPMIAVISRLVDHKGLDLVRYSAYEMLKDDVQLVVLGKGDAAYEGFFMQLQNDFPNKVRTLLKYDKDLSKQIYAASDIFLMPSKSEPCGLSQMIASRYGSVPVVHETGGLYDSIRDIGWEGGGNGFTFAAYDARDMLDCVRRAEAAYARTDFWSELVKKVMRVDFSWKKSAKEYIALYDKLWK